PRAQRDPAGGEAAAQVRLPFAVLPQRGGLLREGHARHDPAAPVRQGGDRADRASREVLRRARGADGARGNHTATAGTAVPRRHAVHGRHGILGRQDLRSGSVAAGPGRLPGDLVVQQLRSVPGASHAGALPEREGQDGARAHAARLGARDRAHARGGPRELSKRGRKSVDTGSAEAVPGWGEYHRATLASGYWLEA